MVRIPYQIDPQWAWKKFEPSAEEDWNTRKAAHLMRRAGFGANPEQIEQSVAGGCDATIERLFSIGPDSAFEAEMKSLARVVSSSGDARGLSSWWLMRMLKSPDQLLEKATLFWHGHFATSAAKVTSTAAMLAQNRMLRDGALGRFEPMVNSISRDVAMLIYLDSTDNRKTRPNENYARELLELFCLGPGNYTEQDIKEIARCFTGWEVRRGSFRFNSHQHDNGTKSFFGESGNFDGTDAVRIVLEHDAAPRFIAGKLIRFYVMDEYPIDAKLVEPIATVLRDTDFDIAATIRTILQSNLFYSEHAIGQKIRGPVELAIGLLRSLDAAVNMGELAGTLEQLGQLPLYPPNVKGWDGGRKWINAASLLGRSNLVRQIVTSGETSLEQNSLGRWARRNGSVDPDKLVDWLLEILVAVEVPDKARSAIIESANRTRNADERVANAISMISVLPEFQLC